MYIAQINRGEDIFRICVSVCLKEETRQEPVEELVYAKLDCQLQPSGTHICTLHRERFKQDLQLWATLKQPLLHFSVFIFFSFVFF